MNSAFDPEAEYRRIVSNWPGGEPAFTAFVDMRGASAKTVGARIDPDAFYSPKDAALLTPWSVRTFEAWRAGGKGPAFSKVSGRVLYRGVDLIQFLKLGRRPSARERAAASRQASSS